MEATVFRIGPILDFTTDTMTTGKRGAHDHYRTLERKNANPGSVLASMKRGFTIPQPSASPQYVEMRHLVCPQG